ncbi:hypothetical protein [Candidatus Desulfovibrio trichonymphae]|uniref:hypothetical protein n=1 Tax=Candidatus Desulfovibrio trichonymphae TaxID=1725232 RepID=UPI0018D547AA|nr:hypothetical protein [Candidatus Desulfovibrio trichonymphae]
MDGKIRVENMGNRKQGAAGLRPRQNSRAGCCPELQSPLHFLCREVDCPDALCCLEGNFQNSRAVPFDGHDHHRLFAAYAENAAPDNNSFQLRHTCPVAGLIVEHTAPY